jgi:tetratricopeptide (TPR) repeat protein
MRSRRSIGGFLATLALLAFAAGAMGQAPPACRAKIDEGRATFGRFHLDPANVGRALALYDAAAREPACAYEAAWRAAELFLNWGTSRPAKAERITNFEKGIARADAAIAIAPGRPEGHYFRTVNVGSIIDTGGVLRNMGKVGEVKRSLDRTLAADPDFAQALIVKGQFLLDMPGIFGGDDAEALALFERARRLAPTCETVYTSLAKFFIKKKRWDDALAALDRLEAMPERDHACLACYLTIDKPLAAGMRAEIREKRK